MFNFSKNKKKNKDSDKNAVDANDILKAEDDANDNELVETELSIPDHWNISNEDRYVYAFHHNESPKLLKNQISILGMELKTLPNKSIVVTALVRSTVQKDIKFSKTSIVLMGDNKEIVARKEIDLERLGVMPPNSARPWRFTFDKEDIIKKDDPLNDWSLAFELKQKHQLDLEESWETSIGEEVKANLEKIVENAPTLKPGEVNLMGLSAAQQDNGDLRVTLLIRNGTEKNLTLHQVPLGLKDVSNEEVARGVFKLNDFEVKANTSKPWTFIFPASVVSKDEIDLSKWQVYMINN